MLLVALPLQLCTPHRQTRLAPPMCRPQPLDHDGVHAALYRGFRVTGWGVNECRRCGKVIRGWQQHLNSHVNRNGCSASAAAEAEAASATQRYQRNSDAVCNAQASGGGGSAAADCPPTMPTYPTRSTTRQCVGDVATRNTCYGSGHDARGDRSRQPCTRGALQPSGDQAAQQTREAGVAGSTAVCSHARRRGGVATVGPRAVVHGGVAWAHGYTTTRSGLKVPLAPMPSRCKRARSVRPSGGSTGGCDGSDSCGAMAASGGSGAMFV